MIAKSLLSQCLQDYNLLRQSECTRYLLILGTNQIPVPSLEYFHQALKRAMIAHFYGKSSSITFQFWSIAHDASKHTTSNSIETPHEYMLLFGY